MRSDDIRASFLEYFRERGHVIERSDGIVPSNDPTLLFSSAGMVQFKPYYSADPVPYRRAATSQKCLRAGGKANDLDEVGKTARHLTFFEMLGNFSFGDYFKREAIAWAWEYSTQVLKLDADLIWVSVYEDDDEAFNIWEKEIGFPARKIVRLGKKDNFWGPAGDTGACGPCSELHLDRNPEREKTHPGEAPGNDPAERFMEYWNLVFPQYDQQLDGSRLTLKNRGIDTGMGLERLAAILQNKETVFDTDGIFPIIEATQALAKVPYATNPVPYRVIADHARSLAFMIADGVLPSNDGRGYVERRLLRRAARFGRELGLERPFLHQVVQTVVDKMSHQYPELGEKQVQIQRIIQTEEERFASTLARGMDMLEELFETIKKDGRKLVPGDDLFRLHDTYGFPLDLATDIATDRGFEVDADGFKTAMQHQRTQARSAWTGSGEEAVSPIFRKLHDEFGATESLAYETLETQSVVKAIVVKGQRVDQLSEGQEGEIILDKTPFYAESGGQIGDCGVLEGSESGATVRTTKAPVSKLVVHYAKVVKGTIKAGDVVLAKVDTIARSATQNHHTATHLLQAALQDILGDHVPQAGSLVEPTRLRFDFTHFEGIDSARLQDIERLVNQFIRTDSPVEIKQMAQDEARAAGAMALFGEKYGDVVRVVTVPEISMELCGGTHVPRTGVIGYFKILSETSISSGVRRIEALCGEPCVEFLQTRERNAMTAAQLLNAPVDDLAARIRTLQEENKRLARDVATWKQRALTGGTVDYLSQVKEIGGVKYLAVQVDDQDAEGLRMLMDSLRDKVPVLVLGSAHEGKVSLCVAVAKDLTSKIKAGEIVKQLAPIVGGGGGGKPEMAQAGGKNPDKLPDAIAQAGGVIAGMLGVAS